MGQEVVLAGLRNWSPERRLESACSLTAMVRSSSRAAWRSRHPGLSRLQADIEKRRSATLTAAVQGFLSGVQVLPFDQDAATRAGVVQASLERIGIAMSLADSQIAGHALALDLTLVSSVGTFKRVRGLTVKDWSNP